MRSAALEKKGNPERKALSLLHSGREEKEEKISGAERFVEREAVANFREHQLPDPRLLADHDNPRNVSLWHPVATVLSERVRLN